MAAADVFEGLLQEEEADVKVGRVSGFTFSMSF